MWIVPGGRCEIKRGVPLPHTVSDSKMFVCIKGEGETGGEVGGGKHAGRQGLTEEQE